MKNGLKVTDICFSYRSGRGLFKRRPASTNTVLNEVRFEVKPENMFGLIGNNGAGKSTLIKLILGMLKPSTGAVSFDGTKPDIANHEWRNTIGFVGGAGSKLLATFSLREHVALYSGLYSRFDEASLMRQLEQYNLAPLLDRFQAQVSFGERILFELLLTLAAGPQLLLLDEPTVGVDPVRAIEIRRIIRSYCRENGACGILTSHNLRDITEVCESGAFLTAGRLGVEFPVHSESVDSLEQLFIIQYSNGAQVAR